MKMSITQLKNDINAIKTILDRCTTNITPADAREIDSKLISAQGIIASYTRKNPYPL